jgi:asparagine synthase (glutamine-hydrolysing)
MHNTGRPLVISAAGEALTIRGASAGLTLLCRGVVGPDGGATSVSELEQRLRSGVGLERLGAPFGAMLIEGEGATVAADHMGFRHVYGSQRDGRAMFGTSARDVAREAGAKLDIEALAVHRMVGFHLNEDTAFAGVTKLPPAHLWRLAGGRLQPVAYPKLGEVDFRPPGATKLLVEEHAARLRALICGFLDEHDGVVLELSGGMDSRMILAAVPPERRKEITGFTIVQAGSNDGPVATELARRYGMQHVIADLGAVTGFDPATAYRMALEAAMQQDGLGAPLSAALYEWAERDVAEGPRLSGHGGELARVGYYLLQPNRPKQTARLADRFFNLWFANNYGVPDAALAPEWAAQSREIGFRRVRETFATYDDVDWMTAMDKFFLGQRLHRWGGATITTGCQRRVTLNPFLDREVLTIMMSLPHRRRWSSQQAVEVLATLDPELASMPLGSGMRPTVLRRPPMVTRMIGETPVRKFAARASRKIMRHRRGERRYAVGAPALAALVVEHWRDNPRLLEPAAGTGLLNQDWLARVLAGTAEAEAASVDFILNLTALLA